MRFVAQAGVPGSGSRRVRAFKVTTSESPSRYHDTMAGEALGGTLIELEGLTKVFDESAGGRSVTALEDITLDVLEGEFLSLVGPSGCGKSTLLRLLSGLTEPTGGRVSIDGRSIDGPISDVGFVFQSPVLMEWRTVRKNVLFPFETLKSSGIIDGSKAEYERRVQDLLELVGLEEFGDAYPNQLSGGMQQRVAICRALLPDPSILLMDEPFSALDEFTRESLNAELLDIWTETGKTIVFVTHNIREAVFLSDRVARLSSRPGRLQAIEEIDLDRPRDNSVRETQEFMEYVSRIRTGIGVVG